MNILFLTQSASLDPFFGVLRALERDGLVGKAGFYVTDRAHYERFAAAHSEIATDKYAVAKEWEIVTRTRSGTADRGSLARLEQRLGWPTLWDAVIADRRLYNGPLATLRQDYTPRFDYQRLLRIVEEGARELEALFDAVRPDVVVSFVCVTFGDFLGYLIARARQVPFLNLRPTRIRNFMVYGESVYEPADRVRRSCEDRRATGRADEWTEAAVSHIDAVRGGLNKYEGVIAPSRQAPGGPLSFDRAGSKLARLLRMEYAHWVRGARGDHHAPSWATSRLYRRVLNPLRAGRVNRALRDDYVAARALAGRDYVFVPLHTEPEVSLLVYSKPFLNQIEVVRNVANSVPIGTEVVVKEHPASIGKRPLSYYRKLLQIPNVHLADPVLPSTALIERARLIVTIAGSVGFEALLLRKPVLTFGRTPFGYLPATMVRQAQALDRLSDDMLGLLNGYHCDERALVHFVAATMQQSAPLNWYSTLLNKPGVYRPDGSAGNAEWHREVERLAHYTSACAREDAARLRPLVSAG